MVDHAMRSPLAYRAADLAAMSTEAVSLAEVPFLVQVNLRVGATSLPLPREPNTTLTTGERTSLWLGPDEWLITGPAGSAPAMIAELTEALDGLHASVVDVSANRAVIDMRGSGVRDLLARGCAIDLHPARWHSGMCAQTTLGRAQVILEQREDVSRIFVRPSFAEYLVVWIASSC